MLTLYTHPMSPCAQKVRITLAEKSLPYDARHVDLPGKENLEPWYLKLNPTGVVPTLVDGDEVVIESSLICEYLEEAYDAGPDLRPAEAHLRAKMRLWMKHVDNKLHPSCGALQWPLAMRPRLMAMGRENALALLDQVVEAPRRERQKRLFEHGLEAPDVHGAVQVYCDTIQKMETALQSHDWVLGDRFTLADIVIAPYFQTLLQYGWTGLYETGFPQVSDWVRRVTARDSWQVAVAGDFSAEKLESLLAQGKDAWPTIRRHANRPGGEDAAAPAQKVKAAV